MPRPGHVVFVGPAASVQFGGGRSITMRVIRVDPRPTYAGWRWIDGYVIDADGSAIGRRSIFVQVAGLVPIKARSGDQPPSATDTTGTPSGVMKGECYEWPT